MSSSFPPQAPPVRREQLIDPYTTIDLQQSTPAQQRRVQAWLLFNANTGAPAAFRMPSYHEAMLSATW
ncbi:hypothetical protein [Nonomuraea pusilla]|uniref:Cyanobactin biosynthesis protein, PatB/AcyB/McaB family n=1 Tax=Nonomuraea pusilla TaxID=46177 RepID=A0A1H7JH24_9ACTN|nr:hypothetical protein [Nonomuraea pusilla]SEK73300.1 cyanobactin biosynthesis protein, PatB/AcyB/McaB family [Nonomuraea pusilla]